ncbi:MAG: squalene/phytoene synthase family protein [Elusimicrobiota bacterium]|nr:squalene/phytoene synthase family protein [Elusimicrobiota bacterium]
MNKPYEAGSSFRPAFLFLRKDQRRALSAYYGFARAVDDIADGPGGTAGKAAQLEAWRGSIGRFFSGRTAEDPLETELARAMKYFPLGPEHFLPVLEGVTQDLVPEPFPAMPDLERYMYRVASVPGLACLAICRYEDGKARLLAEKMGYAVQLTNILRDVAEDYAAGRVYLPAEDLARFGCAPADLGGSNYPPNFIELMKFEAARARKLYAGALALAAPGLKRRLAPALAMCALYRELLEKIARRGFRVKEGRVRLNSAEKFIALIKAWRDYVKI